MNVCRQPHVLCAHGVALADACAACNRCRHGVAAFDGDIASVCPYCRASAPLADVAVAFVLIGEGDVDLALWREYAALPDEPARRSKREREADEAELRDAWATERQRIAAVRGGR